MEKESKLGNTQLRDRFIAERGYRKHNLPHVSKEWVLDTDDKWHHVVAEKGEIHVNGVLVPFTPKRTIVFVSDGSSALAKGVRAALDAGYDVVVKPMDDTVNGRKADTVVVDDAAKASMSSLIDKMAINLGAEADELIRFISKSQSIEPILKGFYIREPKKPQASAIQEILKTVKDFGMENKPLDISGTMRDVREEVGRSQSLWSDDFDRQNTLHDWVGYAQGYLGRATQGQTYSEDTYTNLKKAVGLLINTMARLKAGEVALRHYEKTEKEG